MTDGKAIFDNVLSRPDGGNSHLVPLGNIFQGNDRFAGSNHLFPLCNGVQSHYHVILSGDLNGFHDRFLLAAHRQEA